MKTKERTVSLTIFNKYPECQENYLYPFQEVWRGWEGQGPSAPGPLPSFLRAVGGDGRQAGPQALPACSFLFFLVGSAQPTFFLNSPRPGVSLPGAEKSGPPYPHPP